MVFTTTPTTSFPHVLAPTVMQKVKESVGVGSAAQDVGQVLTGFKRKLTNVGDGVEKTVDVLRIDARQLEQEVVSSGVVARLEITIWF